MTSEMAQSRPPMRVTEKAAPPTLTAETLSPRRLALAGRRTNQGLAADHDGEDDQEVVVLVEASKDVELAVQDAGAVRAISLRNGSYIKKAYLNMLKTWQNTKVLKTSVLRRVSTWLGEERRAADLNSASWLATTNGSGEPWRPRME